jgi:hypothetical protein
VVTGALEIVNVYDMSLLPLSRRWSRGVRHQHFGCVYEGQLHDTAKTRGIFAGDGCRHSMDFLQDWRNIPMKHRGANSVIVTVPEESTSVS